MKDETSNICNNCIRTKNHITLTDYPIVKFSPYTMILHAQICPIDKCKFDKNPDKL